MISSSAQIGLSFYDQSLEIPVIGLPQPIDVFIDRQISSDFHRIDTVSSKYEQMATRVVSLSGLDISLQIQLKPENLSLGLGYLIFVNFGSVPYYSSTARRFNYSKMFCPDGKRRSAHFSEISKT